MDIFIFIVYNLYLFLLFIFIFTVYILLLLLLIIYCLLLTTYYLLLITYCLFIARVICFHRSVLLECIALSVYFFTLLHISLPCDRPSCPNFADRYVVIMGTR